MKKNDFADVLDAAGNLPLEVREELVEILHKRTVDERRNDLARDVKNARSDHRHGKCKVASPDGIMREIMS